MSETSSQATSTTEFPIGSPGDFANATEREEPTLVDLPDPTEPIPVIRHHLHEALLVLADAQAKSQAEDLIEAFRDGSRTSKQSALSRRLGRSVQILEGYLGYLDDEEEELEDG